MAASVPGLYNPPHISNRLSVHDNGHAPAKLFTICQTLLKRFADGLECRITLFVIFLPPRLSISKRFADGLECRITDTSNMCGGRHETDPLLPKMRHDLFGKHLH